jgi:hypothetical protein
MTGLRLTLTCTRCEQTRSVSIFELELQQFDCARCHRPVVRVQRARGVIYILSNACMPGLLKIGFTTRPVQERVDELSASTGVPEPFALEAWYLSTAPQDDEAAVHARISAFRPQKEFFRLSIAEAIEAIQPLLGRPDHCRVPLTNPVSGRLLARSSLDVLRAYHSRPALSVRHLSGERASILRDLQDFVAHALDRDRTNLEYWREVRSWAERELDEI